MSEGRRHTLDVHQDNMLHAYFLKNLVRKNVLPCQGRVAQFLRNTCVKYSTDVTQTWVTILLLVQTMLCIIVGIIYCYTHSSEKFACSIAMSCMAINNFTHSL